MTNSRSTNNNQQNIPEIASYAIGKCIGSGQYGKVHRAVHKKSQTTVALKLINLSSRTRNDIKALRDEIKCHRRLIHPNIVRCLDCFTLRDNQEVAVVTELCSNGDLMEALKLTGPFDESRVGEFAIALIDGLEFLHTRHGIVHRDLKLQNILITESGILKIADFGFAQMFDQSKGVTMTSVKGTPIYMAPELIKEEPYSYLVDIWALGIILFELNSGLPPFHTTNIFKLIEMILHDPVNFPERTESLFKSFVTCLLEKDQKNRLNWPNISTHPFILAQTTEKMEKPNSNRIKSKRPTTTDSGIDIASEQPKAVSKLSLMNWFEVGGVEIGTQVEFPTECIQKEKLPDINWTRELKKTKSEKYLELLVLDVQSCKLLFQAICLLPKSFTVEVFEQIMPEFRTSNLVLQRIMVFMQRSLPETIFSKYILSLRNLLSWSCSIVHYLLQLDSSLSYFNPDISHILESTLQLVTDIISCISKQSSTMNSSITLTGIANLLFQIYIPLVPRILYAALSNDAAISTNSSFSELQNDKWLGTVLSAIKAIQAVFELIHSLIRSPLLHLTAAAQFFDAIVEFGIAYSLFDFQSQFFDGSSRRDTVTLCIIQCISVLVCPNVNNHDENMALEKLWKSENGKILVKSWCRVITAVVQAMSMKDCIGFKFAVAKLFVTPYAAQLVLFGCRVCEEAKIIVLGQSAMLMRKFLTISTITDEFSHTFIAIINLVGDARIDVAFAARIFKNFEEFSPETRSQAVLMMTKFTSTEKLEHLDEFLSRMYTKFSIQYMVETSSCSIFKMSALSVVECFVQSAEISAFRSFRVSSRFSQGLFEIVEFLSLSDGILLLNSPFLGSHITSEKLDFLIEKFCSNISEILESPSLLLFSKTSNRELIPRITVNSIVSNILKVILKKKIWISAKTKTVLLYTIVHILPIISMQEVSLTIAFITSECLSCCKESRTALVIALVSSTIQTSNIWLKIFNQRDKHMDSNALIILGTLLDSTENNVTVKKKFIETIRTVITDLTMDELRGTGVTARASLLVTRMI